MSPLTEPTSIVLAKGQPVPNDPYLYTNTVLLLHGDGTNGSTTILDSSKVAGSPKTVTAVGNAQISTAQSKFGGASIAFDGTGDYLMLGGQSDFAFGAGDWTLEMWLYFTALNTQAILYDSRAGGGISAIPVVYKSTANVLIFFTSGANQIIGTTSLAASTWYHAAVAKNGSTTRLFVNGAQEGVSYTDTNNYITSANRPIIGADGNTNGSSSFFNGYIDDLRITKGVARYTANFTPPTAPFPDF